MIAIADNHIVSMRYTIRDSAGIVLENTLESDPVSYLHGGIAILSILQKQLKGLQAGDKKTVYLYRADGFINDDFVFDVIIDQVRAASKEEVLLGYPVQGAVKKCEDDCECYRRYPDKLAHRVSVTIDNRCL